VLCALTALCAISLPAAVLASQAPAGVVIESTAEASYEDGGVTHTMTSNTVQVRVDELLDVTAATLDAGPVTVRPGAAMLSFLVSNTGNGPEAFTLEVVPSVAGNAFDAALDSIAIDTNDNGVFDAGIDEVLPEPSITSLLAAGASETIFVVLEVPAGIADGAESEINLIARTATGTGAPGTIFAASGENGGDGVVGMSGGMAQATGRLVGSASTVSLVKSALVVDTFGGATAVPGSAVTYTIEASVDGSATIDDLVISDSIPATTQYVANSLKLDGAPLSDAQGDDAGEASASGIRVDIGSVPGGSSRSVSFVVLIEE